MGAIRGKFGEAYPFSAYNPKVHYLGGSDLTIEDVGKMFYFRPDTDGSHFVLPYEQYVLDGYEIVLEHMVELIECKAGQWEPTPLAGIFSEDKALLTTGTPSQSDYINYTTV